MDFDNLKYDRELQLSVSLRGVCLSVCVTLDYSLVDLNNGNLFLKVLDDGSVRSWCQYG